MQQKNRFFMGKRLETGLGLDGKSPSPKRHRRFKYAFSASFLSFQHSKEGETEGGS